MWFKMCLYHETFWKLCTPFSSPVYLNNRLLVIDLVDHRGMAVHTAREPFNLSNRCISGSNLPKDRTGAGITPKSRIRSKLLLGNLVSIASALLTLTFVKWASFTFLVTHSIDGGYMSMACTKPSFPTSLEAGGQRFYWLQWSWFFYLCSLHRTMLPGTYPIEVISVTATRRLRMTNPNVLKRNREEQAWNLIPPVNAMPGIL